MKKNYVKEGSRIWQLSTALDLLRDKNKDWHLSSQQICSSCALSRIIFLLLLLLLHFANIWRKFPLSILLTPAVAIRNELIKRSVISRLHVFVWRTGYGRGNTINTRMHRWINICSTFCKNQRKWCQATFPQINTAVTRSFLKKITQIIPIHSRKRFH